ncbi:MAG: polymerase [Frankiales bacterium]|nr:polymerase [Frankiales bacterium]
MLLDAPSLYFRAFYGIPDSVEAPDGTPVNALRGMLDMTAQLIRIYKPDRLVACFDNDWRPAFRVDALPSYKAHRVAYGDVEEVPDLLTPQVPLIEEALDAFGIARLGVDGFEADDVIGTLAVQSTGPVEIVTGDRDLFQLVRDDRPISVLYTAKGMSNLERVDEAAVTAKYGIPGRSYADFAILRGDPSDGLPGVPGIGAKTAAGLLQTYGTVDAMVKAIADGTATTIAPRLRALLSAHADYIVSAEVVARVAVHAPVPDVDSALPATPKDHAALVAFAERWGVSNSCARLTTALTALIS